MDVSFTTAEPRGKQPIYRQLYVQVLVAIAAWSAAAQVPQGEAKGSAWKHTQLSAADVVANADVALPAQATGGESYFGKLAQAPRIAKAKVPVILFLHGSSGLGLKAIGEWQRWLATLGYASIAPDSMVLPDRITYTSPVGKDVYEKIHALRASEITLVLNALGDLAWADPRRLVLSGASEGGPAAARYQGPVFAGRMIFSWTCEDNYFVDAHRTVIPSEPVLNVMSATDPFFSRTNAYIGNGGVQGHCGAALREHRNTTIVLIPGAPHTLLNVPQARIAVEAWLRMTVGTGATK
jgi:dienelactone hydrolase